MLSIRSPTIVSEVLLTTRDEVKGTDPLGAGTRRCDRREGEPAMLHSAGAHYLALLLGHAYKHVKCIALKFLVNFVYLFYGYGVLPVCVPHACRAHKRPGDGIRSQVLGVTDGCKSKCGCWKPKPGSLEEQPKPLTTEPYLHPNSFFKNKNMIFFIIQSVCIWLAN